MAEHAIHYTVFHLKTTQWLNDPTKMENTIKDANNFGSFEDKWKRFQLNEMTKNKKDG